MLLPALYFTADLCESDTLHMCVSVGEHGEMKGALAGHGAVVGRCLVLGAWCLAVTPAIPPVNAPRAGEREGGRTRRAFY